MEIPVKMKIGSIGSRTMTILAVLLFATLVTGCYDSGYGGPGYYGSSGYYGGNTYYSNNVYRGYGSYPQPGLFGGYAPAHDAWDESSRGRTSYSGGGGYSGGHGAGEGSEHRKSESGKHSGGSEGGTEHGGVEGHGH